MKTVAIYNLKGGVGKTTTAINLSFLAAQSGLRVLLWDLDPQAASSFAFRIRPHVSGFGKRSLETGDVLSAAVKQTDYPNLCVLPADFAYHKLDRYLYDLGNPQRLLSGLLAKLGRDFDVVFLDCPAGYSRLAEGVLTTADAIVCPTLPTVLSLRTVAQLAGQAARFRSRAALLSVLSMVDRRKTLHRRSYELASAHPDIFLSTEVPYASVVEQMAARRTPLPVFAAREPAARAFAQIFAELRARLEQDADHPPERPWDEVLHVVETMIEQLEATERPSDETRVAPMDAGSSSPQIHADIVHRFDTDQQDLERCSLALELRERHGGEFIVVARSARNGAGLQGGHADARIDRSWTVQILAGEMSPLEALERRIGSPQPRTVEQIRAAAGGRPLQRVNTCRSAEVIVEEIAPAGALVPPSAA
jgi:cellulose biosynthesis protein BcsQ